MRGASVQRFGAFQMIRMALLVGTMVLTLSGCVSQTAGPAGSGGPAGSAGTAAPQGSTITRAALERKLLDSCVYRQYRVEAVQRATMIDRCRCATDTALTSLSEGDYVAPRSGGLSPVQEQAMREGLAACFKPS